MEKVLQLQRLLLRSRRLPVLVLGLTLAILAGAILLTTLRVRERIREQIAGRDGEVLHAVVLMEYANEVDMGMAGPITDPGNQLGLVLKTSELKGVLGVRLFDPAGRFVDSFPPDVTEAQLDSRDLSALQALKPRCHFRPAAHMSDLFFSADPSADSGKPFPLLEVNVPLHIPTEERLAGIAQFLIEGQGIAAEYRRLDRHLAWQALVAFAAGGAILAGVFLWAFRRLRRAHDLLAARTDDLVKANQELALAAKTSALGAVTAHLLHGLKNPLAGLHSFVTTHQAETPEGEQSDWQDAIASTRRMQGMIDQVVSVIREEQSGTHYRISLAELREMVAGRVLPLARESGVEFQSQLTADGEMSNHVANLAALILVNLVQNALQATPRGKCVRLDARRIDDRIVFEVRDEGPGFPAGQEPFTPCRSAKEGGTGIGLALSKQLANHLGAALQLKLNTPQGCVFLLAFPASFCITEPDDAPMSAVP